MQLAGKKIVVVGLGKTGIALARFLKSRQASVVVTDMALEEKLASQARTIRSMGLSLELGGHREQTFTAADLIVLSPGVPHTIAPVLQARERGVPVIGEIELAARFIRQPIAAVTGTNGKTTTTELLGDMLARSGFKVFVGGNIGTPLIEYVDSGKPVDIIVAEISSFQLDTIETFRAQVGVLLNITADHLDRYPDFGAYSAAKMRLFENQEAGDVAVLNGADPRVRSLAPDIRAQKWFYPNPANNEQGALLSSRHIALRAGNLGTSILHPGSGSRTKPKPDASVGRDPVLIDLSRIKLRGRHNLENACAASLAALASGARVPAIQDTLDQFKGSAHRLEYIDEVNGIEFFNDSKATNVDAVLRAVECFDAPLILLMGGLDKGGDFRELRQAVARHARKLIVMGRAADLIRRALEDATPTATAASMADAVKQAYAAGEPGDVVLLSPGCASFDMYDNYAQRGEDFRQAVKRLKLQIS